MWRQESGFLEMFLAYYSQFEENLTFQKTYRDFLFDILCLHERSLSSDVSGNVIQTKTEIASDCEISFNASHFSSYNNQYENKLEAPYVAEELSEPLDEDESVKVCENSSHCDPSLPAERLKANIEKSNSDLRPVDVPLPKEVLSQSLLHPSMINASENPDYDYLSAASDDLTKMKVMSEGGSVPLLNPTVFEEAAFAASERRLDSPLKCSLCERAFYDPKSLRLHERRHTRVRQQYECKICKKTFTQASGLQAHLRIHTGERPYACKVCHKTFVQSGTLKIHERIHTGEKPYECKICRKRFRDSGKLRRHEIIHMRQSTNLVRSSTLYNDPPCKINPVQSSGLVFIP